MLLRQYLEKYNMTQRAMSEKLNITVCHLHMLLRGKGAPSKKLAILIEKVTKGEVKKETVMFYEGEEE